MKKNLLTIFLLMLFIPAFSQESSSFLIPEYLSCTTIECGTVYGGTVYGIIIQSVAPDGSVTYTAKNEAYDYVFVVDKYFSLLQADVLYHAQGFINLIGYSEMHLSKNEDGSYLFKGRKTNGRWKEKVMDVGEGVIYGDSSSAYFQAVLSENGGEVPDNAFSSLFPPLPPADMSCMLLEMNTLEIPALLGDYPAPEDFELFIQSGQNCLVVEAGMEGIFGAFYPYKFYYAYSPEAPYQPLAFWGGNMGKDDYFILYRYQ